MCMCIAKPVSSAVGRAGGQTAFVGPPGSGSGLGPAGWQSGSSLQFAVFGSVSVLLVVSCLLCGLVKLSGWEKAQVRQSPCQIATYALGMQVQVALAGFAGQDTVDTHRQSSLAGVTPLSRQVHPAAVHSRQLSECIS